MKTEYIYGLGKDRRELSRFQTGEWCHYMNSLPRKPRDQKGEKQTNAKVTTEIVKEVRQYGVMPRPLAVSLAKRFGVSVPYIYQLRQKKFGGYLKWPHVK